MNMVALKIYIIILITLKGKTKDLLENGKDMATMCKYLNLH